MTKDLYSQFEDFQNQARNAMQPLQDSAAGGKETDLYSEFEAFQNDNNISSMKASVLSSASINPNQAAQQYQMSKKVNLPVNIFRAKENEIKQMTELNAIDYETVARDFPAVAMQLSDPNKVGAIRDDVDKLSYFEKVAKNTAQDFQSNLESANTADLRFKKMLFDVSGKEDLRLSPREENELALFYQGQQDRSIDYKLGTLGKIPAYTIGQIPNVVDIAKTAIPTAIAGFAVGGPAGATFGGGAGIFTRSGKLMTVEAYDEFSKFVDENGEPIEKEVAAGAALLAGGIGGALELFPAKFLTAPLKKLFTKEGAKELMQTSAGREALKNIGKSAFAEGSTEALQEYTKIAFGESAKAVSEKEFTPFDSKKEEITPEKIISFLGSKEVADQVKENFIAGFFGGAGFATVGSGITYAKQSYDKKQQSSIEKKQIKETTQNVKESKTFNRSQELFKDVTEETLGQQNVYIPAEKVQTYFQDKTPKELEAFYEQVPEAKEQMQDALETGGNLILKGNNAYAAFAQDAYAPLQDFASLSPEFIDEQAFEDVFLQDVVSNVAFDENVKKTKTEQDLVNKNIETQIQNLGMPYRDAKDLITLTKAFYETNLKRYGNEQATKLLNNYFKNLQIKNEVYVDDVAEMLKKARSFKTPKTTKPLLKFLKEKGGVKLGSNLAGELNALGITPKTAPALFKKDKGIGDVDNIVASEFAERFPNINAKAEGDYVDRQTLLDLLANEAAGADITRVQSEEQRLVEDFIQQLDELGLDLNAPDEEIKRAIDEYRKGGYNQSQAPAFYSALEKQITDLPQGKGSPEQWAGIIKNLTQKGVKQEEIDWTGIEDWIKEQKGSISKEQILDYLSANKIEDVGEVWSLEITPAMRESIQQQGLPLFQKSTTAPRGQFKYLQGKPIISLFQDKNKSTLLHELGHTFLEIQKELSKIPEISEEATKDWKVLEDWLDIKDGNITVEAHEKFARGFEAYLREGKAPSIELRNAFARFFTWLTRIYKDVLQLNVKLNNEVREVFDRMLATQEAIDAQKNNPLFRVDDNILELLSTKEKEDYLRISENAGLEAREKLTKKALRQKEKENTQEYKEQRAIVKEEIKAAMEASPVYRALNFFKTGELYGAEEAIEPYKLNEEQAKTNYPEFYKKLKNKDIFEEDGVDLDIAAEDFGFRDGGVMLNSLSSSKPFNQELKRAVDEEMIRRFGDMLFDGTIEEEAKETMQNDARANKILYELNGINRKVRTYVDNKAAYKQKAQEIFAKKTVSVATDSNQFYVAEIKAAREAGKALGKKDYEKAVAEKKKQLLNHYLYRESLEFKKQLQSSLKKYAKYKKPPVVGKVKIEEDYRERIVGLLADFGLARKIEGVDKTDIAELEKWKQVQAQEGVLGLVEFPELANFQNKTFKQLTIDEFRTFDDAIENLSEVGQSLRFIEIEGKRVELSQIANEISESIASNLKEKPLIRGNLTPKQKATNFIEGYIQPLIKAKNTALKLDGDKPLGVFHNYFIKQVSAAELKRNEMSEQAFKKLDEIYKKHFGTKAGVISGKKTFIKEVNFSYSKQDLIAFALNYGNETNRRRLRDGFGYSDSQLIALISKLDRNELEFVQDVWDFIGSYFEDIASLQKKLVGFAPKKVKASEFEVMSADGIRLKLKGGYYPLSYKDQFSKGTTEKDLEAIFGGNPSGYMSFEKSYTKARTEQKIDKEVELTLKPLFKHISNVIDDLSMKEAVWNSYKILNKKEVKKAIKERAGDEVYKQLDLWLKDIFGSGLMYQDTFSSIFSNLKAGATISKMGLKLSTVLIQSSGFAQSVVKIGYKNMLVGMFKTLGNGNPLQINKNVNFALEKSEILKTRAKTFHRDIYDTLRKMERKNLILAKASDIYFYPLAKMQMMVDIPTWYGAYYKGLKDFKGDDKKAAEYADLIVVQSQGSGLEQDLSAFERGSVAGARKSNVIKLFTAFYTYFNAKFNLLSESYRKTSFSKPTDIARFTSDFLLLFWIETLIGELLLNRVPDFGEDDEEDFMIYNLQLTAYTFASQFPILREGASVVKGFDETPSGLSGLGDIGSGIVKISKALTAEEVDIIKVIEGLNDSSGIIFKYPSGQIDVFLEALKDERKGEEVAPMDYILKPTKK